MICASVKRLFLISLLLQSWRRLYIKVRDFAGGRSIPIVALGTKDAWLALRLDDQLENRFQPFLLSRWGDDSETGRLLASFETVIPLREPSGLGLPALRRLIVERSEGLIGEMHQLLSSATAHALMEGRERIEECDLMNCFFQAPSHRRQMMERELRA
ncbi:TniB family NTP-binding protein [Falsirhodobacter algicola]|uniref:TniB family NTP-binding protein n=1 Tax=Falsirhodobacter algicola TaxID=2692330 RepID=UPI002012A5D9|nr:TniB family NTP-binding protein [Falsirhodobacter algicola]